MDSLHHLGFLLPFLIISLLEGIQLLKDFVNKFTLLLGQVGAIEAGKRQRAKGDELLRRTEYIEHNK